MFDVADAAKQGDSLFTGAARGQAAGRARAGALEGSGVDPARAMVDMISSLRSFEAGQRAITTIDETLQPRRHPGSARSAGKPALIRTSTSRSSRAPGGRPPD
ncbi:MAG: flagellar basal body rod C-terminal domain-containing protein [Solirubrobacterales bacterium]